MYSKHTHTILLHILNLLAKYIVKNWHMQIFVILYINEIVKSENNNVNIIILI